MTRRYCHRCKAVHDHKVTGPKIAAWLECQGCKLRTRAYDLRARPWAGV